MNLFRTLLLLLILILLLLLTFINNLKKQNNNTTFTNNTHPILPLLLKSRQTWKNTLQSQPKTIKEAIKEYEERYYPLKIPKGFNDWYHFSILKNFTLINQFDSLMIDLKPFRNLNPIEINQRTNHLSKITGITIIKINNSTIEFKSQSGTTSPGNSFKKMFKNLDYNFPKMILAINENPEARVLPRLTRSINSNEFNYLSNKDRLFYESNDPEKKPSLDGFKPHWEQDGNVWDAYRRACPPDSGARRLVETIRFDESKTGAIAAGGGISSTSSTQTHLSLNRPTRLRKQKQATPSSPSPSRREMTFISNLESHISFCQRPSTHHLHSAFFDDQRSIQHLYPLFSSSKPPGFADILIPSYYHYSPRSEFIYESEYKLTGGNTTTTTTLTDVPWKEKSNKMYWHGKLTRGANTPPGHMSSFQKQRLVKLVSNDSSIQSSNKAHKQGETDPSFRSETTRVLVTLNVSSESLISISAPATKVDPLLLDIALACDPNAGECQELDKQGYHTKPPAPFSDSWKAKLTLDLDDVGFSPRFPALMESHSAVVKMSVHQEFWSDWIQPWYHFIPLSSSFAELHNLITFFLGFPQELISNTTTTTTSNNHNSSYTPTRLETNKNQRRSTIPLPQSQEQEQEQPSTKNNDDDKNGGLFGFDADDELRKIAENGRDWKLRHLRQDDMEVYLFRLLIEWAGILHPQNSSDSVNSSSFSSESESESSPLST